MSSLIKNWKLHKDNIADWLLKTLFLHPVFPLIPHTPNIGNLCPRYLKVSFIFNFYFKKKDQMS